MIRIAINLDRESAPTMWQDSPLQANINAAVAKAQRSTCNEFAADDDDTRCTIVIDADVESDDFRHLHLLVDENGGYIDLVSPSSVFAEEDPERFDGMS